MNEVISVILILITILVYFIFSMFSSPNVIEGGNEKSQKDNKTEDDYPYKRNFMTKQEILDRFDRLSKYKPNFVETHYKIYNLPHMSEFDLSFVDRQVILVNDPDEYNLYSNISDYFIEPIRVRGYRNDDKESSWEYWNRNKKEIHQKAKEKYGKTDAYSLRETLYEKKYELTTFKPTNLAAIIDKFKAKRILDPCSGWGDRLIAAMACNVELYDGFDPNTQLHPKYEEMIKMFKTKLNTKVKMTCLPFEEAKLDKTYDLVFTSPPYFDLEHYVDESTQSIKKSDWWNDFFSVLLRKAWDALEDNGHMVIVINDSPGASSPIIAKMLQYVNLWKNSLYLGVISYAFELNSSKYNKIPRNPERGWKSPQPMWIWKKQSNLCDTDTIHLDFLANSKTTYVLRDDLLSGGTKTRAHEIMQNVREDGIVYGGPNNGYAQCAIGILGKLYNKPSFMFLDKPSKISYKARMLGVNIVVKHHYDREKLEKAAEEFARSKNYYKFSFGLDGVQDLIANNLIKNFDKLENNIKSDVIWLVAGTATILRALYKVWPDATYHVVQVGRTIWPDLINKNTTVHVAPQKFWEDATDLPPYPTIPSYDGKLWQFYDKSKKEGKEEKNKVTLIINVGSDQMFDV